MLSSGLQQRVHFGASTRLRTCGRPVQHRLVVAQNKRVPEQDVVKPEAAGSAPYVGVSEQRFREVQKQIVDGCKLFFQKYDVLSAMIGALIVTTFCVADGQDALTGLSVTFFATIAALVMNEFLDQAGW